MLCLLHSILLSWESPVKLALDVGFPPLDVLFSLLARLFDESLPLAGLLDDEPLSIGFELLLPVLEDFELFNAPLQFSDT